MNHKFKPGPLGTTMNDVPSPGPLPNHQPTVLDSASRNDTTMPLVTECGDYGANPAALSSTMQLRGTGIHGIGKK